MKTFYHISETNFSFYSDVKNLFANVQKLLQIAIYYVYSYFIDCRRVWKPQKRFFSTSYQRGEKKKKFDDGLIEHLEKDYFEIGLLFGK